jgi:hypothetical protein
MHWIINGRRIPPGSATGALQQAVREAALAGAKDQLFERFSRLRHPATGESPTVVVLGNQLEAIRLRIEGSPELLEFVATTMTPEERDQWMPNVPVATAPKVFLGFGSEDKAISDCIATALNDAGVEIVFYAPWDLEAGESIPARISEGLDACTHFLTLWTPTSRLKPWVLEEAYAAYMKRVAGKIRFLIVRHGTDAATIPSIMGHLLSPQLRPESFEADLAELIHSVKGVTRRPPARPQVTSSAPDVRYSESALSVARVYVEGSETGRFADPTFDVSELQASTRLSADEIDDAIHELGDFLKRFQPGTYAAKDELFAELDDRFCDWVPATDALRIAAELVNGPEEIIDPQVLLERFEWTVRRTNAAVTWLSMRRLIQFSKGSSQPMVTPWIRRTSETRRFVKSRSGL